MTGYKFIFTNDPTVLLLAIPKEFFIALQDSVNIPGPVEIAAIYNEYGDLVAFGNVFNALDEALIDQAASENKPYVRVSRCPCYNVWRHYKNSVPMFEEVLHRAERKIVETLLERREVP